MDSPPDPKDSDPEALEALGDDAFAEDGLGLAGPPPTVRQRRKKNEKELSATSKLFDINNDGKLDPGEQKMRDALGPGEKDISKEQVHKWVMEGIRLRHFAYGLAVLVVLLIGSNLGTSLLAVFLAKETMSVGGNLVDAKTKNLLGTQSAASTFAVHGPESRRRLCDQAHDDELYYGLCRLNPADSEQLALSRDDASSIVKQCEMGFAVNLIVALSGTGGQILRKLCPALEVGTNFPAEGGMGSYSFSNEEGVQVLFKESGYDAGFTVQSATGYLKSRVGEACVNDSDCKSLSYLCSDGKCTRSETESTILCNENSPLCIITLDLHDSDRLETSRDAVSTIGTKCTTGIAVDLMIGFPGGAIVRKLCPSLEMALDLAAQSASFSLQSLSFSNEEGVQVRFEQSDEDFAVLSDTSYLEARVGEACSPKVNCKAPLTCSDGKCMRRSVCGSLHENPVCTVNDGNFAKEDGIFEGRLSGVGNVDDALAIRDHCLHGGTLFFKINHDGGAFVTRKICPADVSFDPQHMGVFMLSNKDGVVEFYYRSTSSATFIETTDQYLLSGRGEKCSVGYNSCRDGLACNSDRCY